jgi:septal ring factor EnvC (AmiA/AmiB activator)
MITAPALNQARQALSAAAQQKLAMLVQINDQARKITDLEREVQKQATIASQAQQALANARMEIEALRAQLPDEAAHRAFGDLVQYLSAPAEMHPGLRVAA